ncbi:MAG: hypothetical protein P9L99_19190 [Candidatus Lernaella stagnicola]|nr:hypothetical protein [Candidatus Lernaella stagnicola]
MTIDVYIDELQRFADAHYHAELVASRIDYFAVLGQINEDDDFFEAHLERFLDWFLFEHRLEDVGETALQTFVTNRGPELPEERRVVYEEFLKHVHSLFRLKKVMKKGLQLIDLLTKAKYFVESDVPHAFTKGQLFEARLLPLSEQWHFSKGYIFHPLSATKAILKRAKKIDVADEEGCRSFIRELAIRRLRSDRYKHVDAARFYEFE